MSTDQGENWSAAGLSTTDVRSIAAINDTLFVGTNGAGIYKSVDWGANWVNVNNGLGASLNFRAIESNGNTLFAGGPIGTGVYRSTDFGANWTLLGGGLASGSYRGFASNSQLIVAGSFGAGVFYSTDNGDNWTAINTGLSDLTVFDVELNETYIIAATNTQGVFRFALSNLNLTTDITDLNPNNSISIFPNPSTNQINVSTDITYHGSSYTILDINGKSVIEGKITGRNTIIELDNLSAGTYFLRMGEYSNLTSKFTKQ
jgi:hypothetical protein